MSRIMSKTNRNKEDITDEKNDFKKQQTLSVTIKTWKFNQNVTISLAFAAVRIHKPHQIQAIDISYIIYKILYIRIIRITTPIWR